MTVNISCGLPGAFFCFGQSKPRPWMCSTTFFLSWIEALSTRAMPSIVMRGRIGVFT